MKKVIADVTVKTNSHGVIEAVGRNVIYTPKVVKDPTKTIKWFDDSKLYKKPVK